MLRRLFKPVLKCKFLQKYDASNKYDKCNICIKIGSIDPDRFGQCKHCKWWE